MNNALTIPVITLDGLAGSGKSTIGRVLAERLKAVFFSSGVLYRSVGVWARRRGVDIFSQSAVEEALRGVCVALEVDSSLVTEFRIDGAVISDIYGPDASEAASAVAQYPGVRSCLYEEQRSLVTRCRVLLADRSDGILLVAEGRDMGTAIFPDAQIKVFLEADEGARIQKREAQLSSTLSGEDVQKELSERDRRDSTRKISPTRPAEGALRIVNDFSGVDGIVEVILARIIHEPAPGSFAIY
jgi:cytidylate kinase